MLEVMINEKGRKVISSGTVQDMVVELALAANALYTKVKCVNEEAAQAMKEGIISLLGDADSPAWKQEVTGMSIVRVLPAEQTEEVE